jgi:NhaP-type Na+/H+ or K+/H+ antiporter
VLAAILTPTDAALGKPVVTGEDVPLRVRQTINVESGLNDGIMLPIVTVAVALLAMESGGGEGVGRLLLEQLGLGTLVGALIGWTGGRLLDHFVKRNWVDGVMRQLATLAIGVGAFAGAELAGGNGFVAAFVAGLAFGAAAREHCEGAYDFSADEGELLTLLTFLLFGGIVFGEAFDQFSVEIAIYALLSLTVIRMVPVALSLLGTGLKTPTVAFIGWFGPRGLASILFGVFLLERSESAAADSIFAVVVWTVIFSIVLHGMSAVWLSDRYARWYESARFDGMGEAMDMHIFPVR